MKRSIQFETSGEYTVSSGNVLVWKRDVGAAAGVLTGWFRNPATEADSTEGRAFFMTCIPENGTPDFSKVLHGPMAEVKQQAAALTDQLLRRPSRN